MRALICALAMLVSPAIAQGAPCAAEALETALTGKSECLVLRTYKGAQAGTAPAVLIVVIHGDGSGGGPANYHFPVAEKLSRRTELSSAVAVALIRPGYDDGAGNTSGGSNNNRSDHYTATNVDEVAGVIAKLKQAYKPRRVILVGHSGGAATSAIMLGRHPALVDGAVLVACPCHLDDWRLSRNRPPWTRSESPHRWVDKVPPTTRVVALTGTDDDNTGTGLAQDYVRRLTEKGVTARFEPITGANHNAAFRAQQVEAAVIELATK